MLIGRSVLRGSVVALAALLVLPAHAQTGWRPYQFQANQRYKYALKWTQEGVTSTGYYSLHVRPARDGRLKVQVEGKLGEAECSAAVTVDSPEEVPQHMMLNCMTMAPAVMVFWGPIAGYWVGQELTKEDEWSYSHGEESMSFKVEGNCTHAGQTGKRTVMRQNGEVRLSSCVVMDLALPAAVTFKEEGGDSMEATLEEYSR